MELPSSLQVDSFTKFGLKSKANINLVSHSDEKEKLGQLISCPTHSGSDSEERCDWSHYEEHNCEESRFYTIIGIIEDFMAEFDPQELIKMHCPPISKLSNEHERYKCFITFLKHNDELLDKFIQERTSNDFVSKMDIMELITKHQEKIHDEVLEFITEGCFDYQGFISLWESFHY